MLVVMLVVMLFVCAFTTVCIVMILLAMLFLADAAAPAARLRRAKAQVAQCWTLAGTVDDVSVVKMLQNVNPRWCPWFHPQMSPERVTFKSTLWMIWQPNQNVFPLSATVLLYMLCRHLVGLPD